MAGSAHRLWSVAVLVAAACRGPALETPFRPYPGRMPIPVDHVSATVSSAGPTALDRLTREGLADFRRGRVKAHAELGLFPCDYDPFTGSGRRIYASLAPGVRWLGPSAYYVANPYLLVVLTCANHVTPLGLLCPGFAVTYSNGRIDEVYDGAGSRCWLGRVYQPPYADNPGQLRVMMVNAWDAGLHYAHVDLDASENVSSGAGPANIARVPYSQSSFYHVGRYGANNISPEDRDGWIALKQPQARTVVTVRLWRGRPVSARVPAEATYCVTVDPSRP